MRVYKPLVCKMITVHRKTPKAYKIVGTVLSTWLVICRLRPLWPSVVFVLKLLKPLLGLDSEQSVFLALGVKRSMV